MNPSSDNMSKTKVDILWQYLDREYIDPYKGIPEEKIIEAMSEWAKQQSCEFFKYTIGELKKLVEYNQKVGETITGEELIRAITAFQNSNTEARYNDFIQSQQP